MQIADHLVGMDCLKQIHTLYPTLKRAYIITSSDALIEGVQNLSNWTKNGFPDVMPDPSFKEHFTVLHAHLQDTDAIGLDVQFWKVAPEYINNATFEAECGLLLHFGLPLNKDADTCTCGSCMASWQKADLEFARQGHACEKDNHGIQLATKYGNFKKGQMIPLTNNADVTVNIPMLVDAEGFVFCADGTAQHLP